MERTCVILNPGSRTGDDREALDRALPAGWQVRVTEHPGHARELALEAAADGFATVIAAGGDGTVNEVVNGLAEAALAGRGAPCLGVLPLGTGNDLVRLLGLPPELAEAVPALERGACRELDVGEMRAAGGERRFFVNVAAGGFSGEVAVALTPEIKRTWGPLAYLRAATGLLSELDAYRVRVRCDGVDGTDRSETLELDALNVVVANGRFAGGGLPIAPRARPDDGLLDLVVIPEMPLTGLVVLAPVVLAGRHLDARAVDDGGEPEDGDREDGEPARVIFRRCRSVELESDPPMPWNNDGELVGELSPSFHVMPRALRVLVGEHPVWEEEREETGAAELPVHLAPAAEPAT